jgi:hypothetical protein
LVLIKPQVQWQAGFMTETHSNSNHRSTDICSTIDWVEKMTDSTYAWKTNPMVNQNH